MYTKYTKQENPVNRLWHKPYAVCCYRLLWELDTLPPFLLGTTHDREFCIVVYTLAVMQPLLCRNFPLNSTTTQPILPPCTQWWGGLHNLLHNDKQVSYEERDSPLTEPISLSIACVTHAIPHQCCTLSALCLVTKVWLHDHLVLWNDSLIEHYPDGCHYVISYYGNAH